MSAAPSGIAVVGLACRVPGASDPETFWRNLRAGVESISFFTRDELLASGVPPASLDEPRYVPAKGVLDDVESFDAGFFHLTPLEAERMDPQHRIFLEVCSEALDDAGCDPARFPGPIGVFGGETLSSYLFHLAQHPRIGASVAALQNIIGLDREFLTTLVSYKLDLRGPSFTLQTACSTSLVATCVACQSLQSFECDLALAGGVSVRVPGRTGYLYQEGGIQSPDGHCRAYDAEARGTVGGDGAGVVALKRLEDALADGDPIRAVIRGWALNNDGSNKVGYTAPSVEGQAEAIAVAQALAGVEPETIRFVEGHGTATPLGDPIEVAALTRVFREATERRGFCALGSVKSNIGHLDSAAGVAGLIKAVLALEHGEIPPTVHFRRPNPELHLETSPFFVNGTVIPWPSNGGPRRAGVSSFGLGGTNAHVVVEQAPASEPAESAGGSGHHLLVLSARSAEALAETASRLAGWIDRHPDAHPADVAWTLQTGRRTFAHRGGVVVPDLATAARVLAGDGADEVFTGVAAERRPAYFLLPGQGTLHAGAGRELLREEVGFGERFDVCADALRRETGVDLRDLLAAGPGEPGEPGGDGPGPFDRLEVAHPLLFAIEYALAGLWRDWGVEPAALIGHSLGEWTAACLAGVFEAPDMVRLLAARGRLMDRAPAGAMLGVPIPEEELAELLGSRSDGLELSGINAPALCTVSGSEEAVERLRAELEERNVLCRRVEAGRAFHSSAFAGVAAELTRRVAEVERKAPRIPFPSNRTGTWITPEQATDPAYWGDHVREPVRFGDGMAELLRSGDGALVEVGPGGALGSLARRRPELLGDRPVLSCLPRPAEGREVPPEGVSMRVALGRFWASGGEVDWPGLHDLPDGRDGGDGCARRRVSLPAYPFERRRYWVDLPEGVRSAALPTPRMAAGGSESAAADRGDLGESVVRRGHDRPTLGRPYEAPRTDTERRLAGLWTEVLGIDRVGVHDDFHELGGDSLRALDLLARVREAFGVEPPLRTLIEAPTVRLLAARVAGPDERMAPRSDETAGSDGSDGSDPVAPSGEADETGGVVAIHEPGEGPPLFLVHPAGGHVLGYRALAHALNAQVAVEDQSSVYGLEARGTRPGETPHGTIEEMAEAHLEAVLALASRRPRQPIVLGGASMGGTVAWEMARRLGDRGVGGDRGVRVGLVALFDTPGPGQIEREPEDDAEVLVHLGAGRLGMTAEDLRRLPPEERLEQALARAREVGALPAGIDHARAETLVELFTLHLRAMLRYRPGPYDGRVAFFRAAERRPLDPPHPEQGWIDLATSGIEVHVVPGDHGTMYQPPHVDTLARRLARCLDGIGKEGG